MGIVKLVRGKAVIIHGEDKTRGYNARAYLPIYKEDTVITLDKSRISFRLEDGSILSMTHNTSLVINQSIYDKQAFPLGLDMLFRHSGYKQAVPMGLFQNTPFSQMRPPVNTVWQSTWTYISRYKPCLYPKILSAA